MRSWLVALALVGCSAPVSEKAASSSEAVTSCSADEAAADLATMAAQPISSNHLAGLDLTGGLIFTAATASHCAMNPAYHLRITGTDQQDGWGTGPAPTIAIGWDGFGGGIEYVQLHAGYTGTMQLKTDAHTYVVALGQPILRDGAAWTLEPKELCSAMTGAADGCEYDDGTFGASALGLYLHVENGVTDLVFAFPTGT